MRILGKRVQRRAFAMYLFAGALVLAVLAYLERQWGFFLLEGVWALVSAWALLALARVVPRPG